MDMWITQISIALPYSFRTDKRQIIKDNKNIGVAI